MAKLTSTQSSSIPLTKNRMQAKTVKSSMVFRAYGRDFFNVSKAPRKRGHPKSQTTRNQVALWDLVLRMVALGEPVAIVIALKETKSTAFYARDIMTMAAYGNYISWGLYGWRREDAS